MCGTDEYVVRVSIFGRPFEENASNLSLAKAWTHKLTWEIDNRDYEPVAEVVYAPTGRVVTQPILTSNREDLHTHLVLSLSMLKG